MPTELQQHRYDALVRRVGDLKGSGSKVAEVLTELFPVIDVENVPTELLLLLGTRIAMGRTFLAAGGATFFNRAHLHNPVNSGVIATVLQVHVATAVVQDIRFGPTQNVATVRSQVAVSDLRLFPQAPTLQIQADNNLLIAGVGFFSLRDDGVAGVSWIPPRGMAVLSPGSSFSATPSVDNTEQVTAWLWIERTAEPSELNL